MIPSFDSRSRYSAVVGLYDYIIFLLFITDEDRWNCDCKQQHSSFRPYLSITHKGEKDEKGAYLVSQRIHKRTKVEGQKDESCRSFPIHRISLTVREVRRNSSTQCNCSKSSSFFTTAQINNTIIHLKNTSILERICV